MKFPAIEKYKELSRTRPLHDDWHLNIIECEKMCQNDREVKHLMNYIHNPNGYNFEEVESPDYLTVGDLIDQNKLAELQPLPKEFQSTLYKNGNEMTIINKYVPDQMIKEEDDEKVSLISK